MKQLQFIVAQLLLLLLLLINDRRQCFAQNWDCPPTGVHQIQHPYSCSLYILCINGNGNIRPCAPGTYFDPNAGNCNLAGVAQCNPCADNVNGEITFVGSTTDCADYYICVGLEQVARRCADPLWFNQAINACDARQNVDCQHDNEPPPPPPPPPIDPDITEAECPDGGTVDDLVYLPHPTSCQHYFICVNGRSHLRSCAAGFIFDVIHEHCDLPASGTCLLDYQVGCQPTGITFHPHPHNCRHYFICIDSAHQLRTCAANLLFDMNVLNCNRQEIARCFV